MHTRFRWILIGAAAFGVISCAIWFWPRPAAKVMTPTTGNSPAGQRENASVVRSPPSTRASRTKTDRINHRIDAGFASGLDVYSVAIGLQEEFPPPPSPDDLTAIEEAIASADDPNRRLIFYCLANGGRQGPSPAIDRLVSLIDLYSRSEQSAVNAKLLVHVTYIYRKRLPQSTAKELLSATIARGLPADQLTQAWVAALEACPALADEIRAIANGGWGAGPQASRSAAASFFIALGQLIQDGHLRAFAEKDIKDLLAYTARLATAHSLETERCAAISALLPNEAVVEELLSQMENKDALVRESALFALSTITPQPQHLQQLSLLLKGQANSDAQGALLRLQETWETRRENLQMKNEARKKTY